MLCGQPFHYKKYFYNYWIILKEQSDRTIKLPISRVLFFRSEVIAHVVHARGLADEERRRAYGAHRKYFA